MDRLSDLQRTKNAEGSGVLSFHHEQQGKNQHREVDDAEDDIPPTPAQRISQVRAGNHQNPYADGLQTREPGEGSGVFMEKEDFLQRVLYECRTPRRRETRHRPG